MQASPVLVSIHARPERSVQIACTSLSQQPSPAPEVAEVSVTQSPCPFARARPDVSSRCDVKARDRFSYGTPSAPPSLCHHSSPLVMYTPRSVPTQMCPSESLASAVIRAPACTAGWRGSSRRGPTSSGSNPVVVDRNGPRSVSTHTRPPAAFAVSRTTAPSGSVRRSIDSSETGGLSAPPGTASFRSNLVATS